MIFSQSILMEQTKINFEVHRPKCSDAQSIQDSIESELPQRILSKLPQEYQCRHSSSVLWIYMLFCQGFQYCVHLYTLHMYSKYPKFCGVTLNTDEILRHWYSQGSFDNFRQGSSLSIESYMLCVFNPIFTGRLATLSLRGVGQIDPLYILVGKLSKTFIMLHKMNIYTFLCHQMCF